MEKGLRMSIYGDIEMSEERIAIIDGCLYNEKTGEVCIQARFVQKLVRCKDCKHYLDGGCGNVDKKSPSKNLMGVKPDWYCADGERETNGDC